MSLSVVTGQPLSTDSNKTINLRANNKASGKEGWFFRLKSQPGHNWRSSAYEYFDNTT